MIRKRRCEINGRGVDGKTSRAATLQIRVVQMEPGSLGDEAGNPMVHQPMDPLRKERPRLLMETPQS